MDKMRDIDTRYFDIAIEILFLILIFLAPTIFDRRIGIVFSLTKVTVIRILTSIILGVWAIKILIKSEAKFIRTILDWPVASYMLSCTIATITSVHVYTSLIGFYGRYEGLITLYNYGLLFFITINYISNLPQIKRLLATVTAAGTLMSIYGIIQRHGIDPYAWGGVITWERVIGTIGQPNFFAAYQDMAFMIALGLLLLEKKREAGEIKIKKTKKKVKDKEQINLLSSIAPVVYFILVQIAFIILIYTFDTQIPLLWYLGFGAITCFAILFAYNFEKTIPLVLDSLFIISITLIYISILYTQSRGGYIGFLGGGSLFVLLAPRNLLFKNWKKLGILSTVLLIITLVIMLNPATSPLRRFAEEVKPVEVTREEVKMELGGAAGSRAETWKSAFRIIADYPLFGIGPEVLKMVFPRYETELFRFKEAFHVKQDRCHNEIFDVNVTKGMVSFAIYVWVLWSVFSFGWKKLKIEGKADIKIIVVSLLSASLAYLMQNQFSFGVVAITSLLWVMMGIIVIPEIAEEEEELPKSFNLSISDIPWLSVTLVLIAVLAASYLSTIPFRADKAFKSGKTYMDARRFDQALIAFKEALDISPYEGGHNTYYGITYLNIAQNVVEKKEWFLKGISIFEKATLIDPYNADNFYILGKTYLTLYDLGERDLLKKSIENSDKAIKIDPYYAEAYHDLGLAYEKEGKLSAAASYYKKAFMINPNLIESMAALSSVYSKEMIIDAAIKSFEEALKKYPGNIVIMENLAGALSKRGQFTKAIDVYKEVINKDPKNVRVKIALGSLYIQLGKVSSAESNFLEAVLLDPVNIDAHNGLGLVYLKKGQKDKAISEFKETLLLAPDNEYAKKMLKALGE